MGDGGSVADKDLLSFFLVINGGKQAPQHAAAKWENFSECRDNEIVKFMSTRS